MKYNKATNHDKENAGKDRNLGDMTWGRRGRAGAKKLT